MPFQTLILEVTGDIATLTLNRPEKRNAMSRQVIEDLMAALAEAESSRAPRKSHRF